LETEKILELFYSGQSDNIELALVTAKSLKFDLKPIITALLQVHGAINNSTQTKPQTLPQALAAVINAEHLDLMCLTDFPKGLHYLPKLKSLHVEHFHAHDLKSEKAIFPSQLEKLSLHFSMAICPLPLSICALPKLRILDLDNNSFSELPPEIGQLQSLEILSLRGNLLMSLPEEIAQLTQLKKLYLAQNQLQISLIPTSLKNKEKTNKVIVNALRNIFKW
jgi:Leucine-rich repeat (LRR) protein